jgi:hypothetical protein
MDKDSLIKELLFNLFEYTDADPELLDAQYRDGTYNNWSIEDLQWKLALIQETVANELYSLQ